MSQLVLWPALAYGMLGITVGIVAGVSEAEVTQPMLTALLTGVGVAAVLGLAKANEDTRNLVAKLLLAFCTTLLLGLAGGVALRLELRRREIVPAGDTILKRQGQALCPGLQLACEQGDVSLMRDIVDSVQKGKP